MATLRNTGVLTEKRKAGKIPELTERQDEQEQAKRKSSAPVIPKLKNRPASEQPSTVGSSASPAPWEPSSRIENSGIRTGINSALNRTSFLPENNSALEDYRAKSRERAPSKPERETQAMSPVTDRGGSSVIDVNSPVFANAPTTFKQTVLSAQAKGLLPSRGADILERETDEMFDNGLRRNLDRNGIGIEEFQSGGRATVQTEDGSGSGILVPKGNATIVDGKAYDPLGRRVAPGDVVTVSGGRQFVKPTGDDIGVPFERGLSRQFRRDEDDRAAAEKHVLNPGVPARRVYQAGAKNEYLNATPEERRFAESVEAPDFAFIDKPAGTVTVHSNGPVGMPSTYQTPEMSLMTPRYKNVVPKDTAAANDYLTAMYGKEWTGRDINKRFKLSQADYDIIRAISNEGSPENLGELISKEWTGGKLTFDGMVRSATKMVESEKDVWGDNKNRDFRDYESYRYALENYFGDSESYIETIENPVARFVTQAVGGTAGQFAMYHSAGPLAVAGAAAGGIAGSVIPGAGTVAGAKIGAQAAGFMSMYKIERGLAYVQMREDGADHEAAQKMSNYSGVINAGIELLEVGMLLKGTPLAGRTIARSVINKIPNKLIRGAVSIGGAQALLAGSEITQEGIQQLVTNMMENEAFRDMQERGVSLPEGYQPMGAKELISASLEEMKAAAPMMVLMSFIGLSANYSNYRADEVNRAFDAKTTEIVSRAESLDPGMRESDPEKYNGIIHDIRTFQAETEVARELGIEIYNIETYEKANTLFDERMRELIGNRKGAELTAEEANYIEERFDPAEYGLYIQEEAVSETAIPMISGPVAGERGSTIELGFDGTLYEQQQTPEDVFRSKITNITPTPATPQSAFSESINRDGTSTAAAPNFAYRGGTGGEAAEPAQVTAPQSVPRLGTSFSPRSAHETSLFEFVSEKSAADVKWADGVSVKTKTGVTDIAEANGNLYIRARTGGGKNIHLQIPDYRRLSPEQIISIPEFSGQENLRNGLSKFFEKQQRAAAVVDASNASSAAPGSPAVTAAPAKPKPTEKQISKVRENLGKSVRKVFREAVAGSTFDNNTKDALNEVTENFISGNISIADAAYELYNTAEAMVIPQKLEGETAEVVNTVRRNPINITDDLRGDIPDFEAFRKRSMGINVRLVSEGGTDMDVLYQELSGQYPWLFLEDVTHPADQLMTIVDVINDARKNRTVTVGEMMTDREIYSTYVSPSVAEMERYSNWEAENGLDELHSDAGESENNSRERELADGGIEADAAQPDTRVQEKDQSSKGKTRNRTQREYADNIEIDQTNADNIDSETEAALTHFGKYTEKELVNWETGKRIEICESVSQFKQFISDAQSNLNLDKKLYFGKIPTVTAEQIYDDTGVDVKGYNVSLAAQEIRKILKSHGSAPTEDSRGQRAITANDILLIPTVIADPDSVELSGAYKGRPVIKFEKDINGRAVAVTYASARSHDLIVQTMYAGKKKSSLARFASEQALADTPEAETSTATEIKIPQSENDVNIEPEKNINTSNADGQSAGVFNGNENSRATKEPKSKPASANKTEPRGPRKPKGLVEDEAFERAKIPYKQRRVLDALADISDTSIRFAEASEFVDEEGRAIPGNALYKDGEIVVNRNTKLPVRTVVMHELVHRVRDGSEADYDALRNFVAFAMEEEQWAAAFDKRTALYEAAGVNYAADPDAITEEVVADAIGFILGDSALMERFATENRNLFQKIMDALISLFTAIRDRHRVDTRELSEAQKEDFAELSKELNDLYKAMRRALENVGRTDKGAASRDARYSAMYRNPATNVEEFYEFALKNRKNPNEINKSYFTHETSGGNAVDLSFEAALHLKDSHNLTPSQVSSLLNGIDDIRAYAKATDVGNSYNGTPVKLVINADNKYAGALLEVLSNGRVLVRTAFFDTEKNLANWIRKSDSGTLTSGNKAGEYFTGNRLSFNSILRDTDIVNSKNTENQTALTRENIEKNRDKLPKYSIAYHGTPHTFDEFLLDHIGSGEGGQAHGWGLYFAANEETAKKYQKALGGDAFYADGEKLSNYDEMAALDVIEYGPNARDDLERRLKLNFQYYANPAAREHVDKILEAYDRIKDKNIERRQEGNVYAVDIPDEDVMLNEQLPLSEQPEKVRDAIYSYMPDADAYARNGKELYEQLIWQAAEREGVAEDAEDEWASRKLNELGVKGIVYDGRQDGKSYVVFDDKAIKILDDAQEALKPAAGQVKFSAMYRNPADSIEEFYDFVVSNKGDRKENNKSYYSQKFSGGSEIQIFFDGINHMRNDHGLTAKDVSDIVDSLNNIESVYVEPGTGAYHGTATKMKIHTSKGNAAALVEYDNNGRIILRTAFYGNDARIDKWQKQNGSKTLIAETDDPASASLLGNRSPQASADQQRTTLADVDYLDLESINSLLRDNAGVKHYFANEHGPKARFSISEESIEPAPVFYSKMEREIEGMKQSKIAAASVPAFLKGRGVKEDEIKWSGLRAFAQGKAVVTKDNLLEFVRGSALNVTDITKGTVSGENADQAHDVAMRNWRDWAMRNSHYISNGRLSDVWSNDLYDIYEKDGRWVAMELQRGEIEEEFESEAEGDTWLKEKKDELSERVADSREMFLEDYPEFRDMYGMESDTVDGQYSDTKYEQYSNKGGTNYREVLFTLPGFEGKFQSQHWNEKNVLAHARLQDFSDKDGDKVLFVEEVQSDWHEQGREKGYQKDAAGLERARIRLSNAYGALKKYIGEEYIYEPTNSGTNIISGLEKSKYEYAKEREKFSEDAKGQELKREYLSAQDEHDSFDMPPLSDAVPDAPYRDTWHEYVMKRVLRMGAESGYDKIAWTTGKMQNDRYDLAKVLSKVLATKYSDGSYFIQAYDPNSKRIALPGNSSRYTESDIRSTFGKDLGQTIIDNAGDHSKGAELAEIDAGNVEFRGEGMRNFYDIGGKSSQNIPKFMNKYLKPWGVAVENDTLSTGDVVPSVTLTEEMKRDVVYKGQPRFSLSEPIEETAKRARRILDAEPVKLTPGKAIGKKEAETMSRAFGLMKNEHDGRVVRFPVQSVGKTIEHQGYDVSTIFKYIPRLYKTSMFAWSDNESTKEGRKGHNNIEQYHNYVNKYTDGRGEYFIRFTVTEMKARPGKSGDNLIHSTAISEVAAYKQNEDGTYRRVWVIDPGVGPVPSSVANKSDSSAASGVHLPANTSESPVGNNGDYSQSVRGIDPVLRNSLPFVDDRLQQFFDTVNRVDEKKSSGETKFSVSEKEKAEAEKKIKTESGDFYPYDSGVSENIKKRAKEAKGRVKSEQEIINELFRKFGIVEGKRLSKSKKEAVGRYYRGLNMIRLKDGTAMHVAAHEVGHYLDEKYGLSKKFGKQLAAMVDKMPITVKQAYSAEELPGEALADFVNAYIMNPDRAEEFAQGTSFFKDFESALDKKDLSKLRESSIDALAYQIADAKTQIEAQSKRAGTGLFNEGVTKVTGAAAFNSGFLKDVDGIVPGTTSTIEYMRTYAVDMYNPLRVMALKINQRLKEQGRAAMFGRESLEMLTTLEYNSANKAYNIVFGDFMSSLEGEPMRLPDGRYVPSLKHVLDPLRTGKELAADVLHSFSSYLKALDSLDRFLLGKYTFSKGTDESTIRAAIAHYEEKYPLFKDVAAAVYEWQDAIMQEYAVKSGIISQELYDTWKKLYPHHMPEFRVKEGGKRGGMSMAEPFMRTAKEGGTGMTYDAIDCLILQTQNIVKAANQRALWGRVHDMFTNDSDARDVMKEFIVPTESTMTPNVFNAISMKGKLEGALFDFVSAKIKKESPERAKEFKGLTSKEKLEWLAKEGYTDVVDSVISDSIKFYTVDKVSKDSDVISLPTAEGYVHYKIVNPAFKLMVEGMTPKEYGRFYATLSAGKRALTALTTGLNISFSIFSNIVRDIPTAYIQGKWVSPVTFVWELVKAMGSVLGNTEMRKLAKSGGAGFDSLMGAERARTYNSIQRGLGVGSRNLGEAAMRTGGKLLDILELINNFTESIPRQAAFNYSYRQSAKKNPGISEADKLAIAQREYADITVNFKQHGAGGQGLRGTVYFLNAYIQAMDKMGRTLTGEGKAKAWAKLLGAMGITAIALALKNYDDEDYEILTPYEKNNYWHPFKIPGTSKFIRIRKPQEYGIFGNIFEQAVISYFKGEWGENFKDVRDQALQTLMPPMDIIATPFIMTAMNKPWYDPTTGEIVNMQQYGDYIKTGNYDDVYDETTSSISRFLNKFLPEFKFLGALNTPMGKDYLLAQTTGFVGQYLLPAFTPTEEDYMQILLGRVYVDASKSNALSSDLYYQRSEYNVRADRIKNARDSNPDYVYTEQDKVDYHNHEFLGRVTRAGGYKGETTKTSSNLLTLFGGKTTTESKVIPKGLGDYAKEIKLIEAAAGMSKEEKNKTITQLRIERNRLARTAYMIVLYGEPTSEHFANEDDLKYAKRLYKLAYLTTKETPDDDTKKKEEQSSGLKYFSRN